MGLIPSQEIQILYVTQCRKTEKNPNKRSPSEQFQYVSDPPVSISVSPRRSLDVYHEDEKSKYT